VEETGIWIVGLVLLLAGVVLLVVGRKQSVGKLRRNRLVGLRTPQTLRSDAAWYAAHEATAGLVGAAGVVQILAGAAMLVLRPTGDGAIATIVLGGGAVTVGLVLAAGIRGDRIAAGIEEGEPGAPPET